MKVISFMLKTHRCFTLVIMGLGSYEVPKIDSPALCGGRSKNKGFLHLNRVKTLESGFTTNSNQQVPTGTIMLLPEFSKHRHYDAAFASSKENTHSFSYLKTSFIRWNFHGTTRIGFWGLHYIVNLPR